MFVNYTDNTAMDMICPSYVRLSDLQLTGVTALYIACLICSHVNRDFIK